MEATASPARSTTANQTQPPVFHAGMELPKSVVSLSGTDPSPNYDEQLGETFTRSFTSMAYNVTAVAQVDSDGYGPAYLLNGLSNEGYWYQVGLAYDWDGTNSGFGFVYEVFSQSRASIFPTNGQGGLSPYSGTVSAGDDVLLNLYFSGGNVIMHSYDYDSGASASQSYYAYGTQFLGLINSASAQGFFTGLMTEQYHVNAYYGNEQFVVYSDQLLALTSAWLWMDEYNVVTNQTTFITGTLSPVSYDNYYQLHEFSSNGSTEYADAYVLDTGADPVSMNLSPSSVVADSGMLATAQFTANPSGGTPPYLYLVFLDNKEVHNRTATSALSTSLNLGLLPTGPHVYYVDVIDSNGYPASSQSVSFSVNPDPTLSISSRMAVDMGQSILVDYQLSLGTPPYTETLYLNGAEVGQTDTATLTSLGQNQVYAKLMDGAGYLVTSNTLSITMNPDPTLAISSQTVADKGQTVTIDYKPLLGTPPYTETLYVDGVAVSRTDTTTLTQLGSNQVYANLTDAVGYTVSSNDLSITVNPDPVVTIELSNSSTDAGLSVALTASVVNGTTPFSVQWFANQVPIPGGDTSSFVPANAGSFVLFAQITDGTGYKVNSSTATLTVNSDPTVSSFSPQPESTSFFLSNNSAIASAHVSGGLSPYTYTWYLNGIEVAKTTSPSYDYTFSDMGTNLIRVNVTDAAGYAVSSQAIAIGYGYDFIHIAMVVGVVAVALALGSVLLRQRAARARSTVSKPDSVTPQRPVPPPSSTRSSTR